MIQKLDKKALAVRLFGKNTDDLADMGKAGDEDEDIAKEGEAAE
jgi:hypothetical protein